MDSQDQIRFAGYTYEELDHLFRVNRVDPNGSLPNGQTLSKTTINRVNVDFYKLAVKYGFRPFFHKYQELTLDDLISLFSEPRMSVNFFRYLDRTFSEVATKNRELINVLYRAKLIARDISQTASTNKTLYSIARPWLEDVRRTYLKLYRFLEYVMSEGEEVKEKAYIYIRIIEDYDSDDPRRETRTQEIEDAISTHARNRYRLTDRPSEDVPEDDPRNEYFKSLDHLKYLVDEARVEIETLMLIANQEVKRNRHASNK